MPETNGVDEAYAATVLDAALSGGSGDNTETAATTVAAVLVALVPGAADGRAPADPPSAVAAALAAGPDGSDPAARFEVRSGARGGRKRDDAIVADAGQAVREAARLVAAGESRVEVTAVGASGSQRVVLRGGKGRLAYVFPERPREVKLEAADETGRTGAATAGAAGTAPSSEPGGTAESEWAAEAGLELRLRHAVRQALDDVTVEVDMGAIEQVVGDTIRDLWASTVSSTGSPEPASSGQADGRSDTANVLLTHMATFEDRMRAASQSLVALADELHARDRESAAIAERVGRSVTASVDRLARRIDSRLDLALPSTRLNRPAPESPAIDSSQNESAAAQPSRRAARGASRPQRLKYPKSDR